MNTSTQGKEGCSFKLGDRIVMLGVQNWLSSVIKFRSVINLEAP